MNDNISSYNDRHYDRLIGKGYSDHLAMLAVKHRSYVKSIILAARDAALNGFCNGNPNDAAIPYLCWAVGDIKRAPLNKRLIASILIKDFGVKPWDAKKFVMTGNRRYSSTVYAACGDLIGDRELIFRPHPMESGQMGTVGVYSLSDNELLATVGPATRLNGMIFFCAMRAANALWLDQDMVPYITVQGAVSNMPWVAASDAGEWAKLAEASRRSNHKSIDDESATDYDDSYLNDELELLEGECDETHSCDDTVDDDHTNDVDDNEGAGKKERSFARSHYHTNKNRRSYNQSLRNGR